MGKSLVDQLVKHIAIRLNLQFSRNAHAASHRGQTLELEPVDRASLRAVHVIAEGQDDFQHPLQHSGRFDRHRRGDDRCDLGRERERRLVEVADEDHDVQPLLESFDPTELETERGVVAR